MLPAVSHGPVDFTSQGVFPVAVDGSVIPREVGKCSGDSKDGGRIARHLCGMVLIGFELQHFFLRVMVEASVAWCVPPTSSI